MAGTMNIVIENYDSLMQELSAMHGKSEKVVRRTLGDFRTRGPGWVSQEVVKEYNIKKKDVNEAKNGVKNRSQIKVAGTKVDDIAIIYKGRLLTPTHFAMKPTSRPASGKAYTVSAQIKKSGGRKALGHKVFLGASGNQGTKQIPFQRKGDARLPIQAVKTLSVPQMVTNEKVASDISRRINEELGKRLDHHMKQLLK